jgi:GR25 family glycosyltransferase involved in LPS biosynthesis
MDFKIPENKKKATICLNMIVKNESHIIENTLEKLCNKISFDYWVICDTGSTDNTVQIITDFFEKKGVKGEMFHDEWKNFSHNRTLALDRAYKKTDLLLVFDADDELVGDFVTPTEVLYDEYHLKFGSSFGTSYTRVLLINNHKRFQYLSVIHEFISSRDGPSSSTVVDGNYFVVSGRSGSRNQDPDKYLKDALVLEKAYDEAVKSNDHLFHRYAFYCANSFKDCGKFEEAIKWYKTTLSHEHQWPQEKYVSCLYINECLNKLDRREEGFFYLVKAFQYDNERVECLYPLLQHYCCENMPRIAYNYYLIIKDFFENTYLNSNDSINDVKKLFVIQDKFTFFVPYYMILIADKVQDFQCVVKMFEIVFKKKQLILDEWYIKNLLYNLQFFLTHVNSNELTKFVSLANDYLKFLSEIGINIQNFDFLLKDEYRKFDINVEKYFIKEIENKPNIFSKEECSNSKNILIYTGFSDFDWNNTYMKKNALGGSEKAVAYLSKCFPKDYKIFISGAVANETIDNIQYINLGELTNLINKTPFHTLIVSRYISFYEMFQNCSFYQSFIWAHDILLLPYGCNLNENQILKKWDKYINGCICLTEWHRNLFMEKYPTLKDKIKLINNGLDLDSFKANTNNKIKNKFIYTSRPDRGLNNLLKLWPQILEKIPDAILTISSYGEFPTTPEYKLLKNIIDNTDSIIHLGKLSISKLYEEMASSEFWLYPTHWPETSCITALEMLMSEVICLYYPIAGLTHTIDKYGIIVKPGSEIETIVSLTESQKEELRENGQMYAKSCSWQNRFNIWEKILNFQTINYNYDNNFIKVINLERRKDRLESIINKLKCVNIEKYEIIEAVDGNKLQPNLFIKELFEGNDFNYRKGVIGCALSHYKLWNNLINDINNNFYCIFEDDITFVDNFKEKLEKILNNFDGDFCLLGGGSIKNPSLNISSLNIIERNEKIIDGLYGYLITKKGADKMIKYISENKIKRAIDSIYSETFPYIKLVNEYLVFTPSYQLNGNIETDIQLNYDKLLFSENINKPIWIFYVDKTFKYNVIEDYLNSYKNKYNFLFVNDINEIPLNADKIFIVNHYSDILFNKFFQSEISVLNIEPLNYKDNLDFLLNISKKHNNIKFYSYSNSNIKILNDNYIFNTEFLPYNVNELEDYYLKELNKNNKEYDFGIIGYTPNFHESIRKKRIFDYLVNSGFRVNVIIGWNLKRDIELSKCKTILNIHSSKINTSGKHCEIFEHIRCDRLLSSGFNIISEESIHLDKNFIQKYPNLTIINYEDFFKNETYTSYNTNSR